MSITKQQLTAKWKNLKSKLNKYCDKVRKEREATGGGPSTPPDPAMEKLWDVFGRDCPTLNKVKNARTSISGMSVTSRTAEGSQPNGTGSTPQQDGPPALGIALVPSPGELPDLGGSNGNIPLLGDEFLIEVGPELQNASSGTGTSTSSTAASGTPNILAAQSATPVSASTPASVSSVTPTTRQSRPTARATGTSVGSNETITAYMSKVSRQLEALDLEKALREIQLQTADSEKAARHAEVLERDARRSAAMAEVTAWEEQALYYRAKRLRISPE
ncbi:hypothetical protein FOZ63_002802 [Perkinsus olseni]|uniref:Uncharacterized protein n=1 Tax=Perkinsus olseni TaxID=32597 RepID=A0A7J6TUB0_PEROL|nr:hypothetical protein FOZ63_002802 [Perkinsus olseni]